MSIIQELAALVEKGKKPLLKEPIEGKGIIIKPAWKKGKPSWKAVPSPERKAAGFKVVQRAGLSSFKLPRIEDFHLVHRLGSEVVKAELGARKGSVKRQRSAKIAARRRAKTMMKRKRVLGEK